jgi:hypothetical protein
MGLIDSLLTDVERHENDLMRRIEELRGELKETKQLLREVARHRERLTRDRSRGVPMLPPGKPEDDRHPRITDGMDGPAEVERELDEEEDASDDDGAATHWDVEPNSEGITEELMAIAPPPKPKRGRKKADAANG